MDSASQSSFLPLHPLKRADLRWTAALLVINLFVLWLVMGNLVFRLNQVSFAKGGDGLKGYYASLWHVRHDTGYHWFEGMNYPAGEHIFYTDSQPLVTNGIKWISENIADIGGSTVGIINSLMLLSIIIGAMFLFLILRKSGVHPVVALIAATTIAWLSPQLGRLGGHFALSYVSHIPGAILFLLLFAEKPNIARSLLITLWSLILALTHFYFFGIVAILLILFWFRAFIVIPRSRFPGWKKAFHFMLQLVVPLLLIQLYLLLTDPVSDRPGTPWGFMHFRAYPESVLLPLHKPYCHWITRLFNTNYIDWEGYSYAGGVASLLFIATFFYLLYLAFRGRFSRIADPYRNPVSGFLFWAGTLALLYSFAVPFVFHLEWLLKYLGPIRQMRGIARFSWLFFYAMQLIVVIQAWRWFSLKRSIPATLVIILMLGMNATEAFYNAKPVRSAIDNPNPLDRNDLDQPPEGVYQAIVPLPYFHVGSENLWWDDKAGLLPHVLNVSLHTGVPTTGVYLSRSSLGQTFSQVEPFLPMPGEPEILQGYRNGHLLLLSSPTWTYAPLYQTLLDSASIILRKESYVLSSIPFSTYRQIIASRHMFQPDTSGFETTGNRSFTDIRSYNRAVEAGIPRETSSVDITFEVGGIREDLMARTAVQLVIEDAEGNVIHENWKGLGEMLTGFKGASGTHSMTFEVPRNGDKFFISLTNREMKKHPLELSDIRIRFRGKGMNPDA